jgi:thiol-disulfide isomerase/thioredoxin
MSTCPSLTLAAGVALLLVLALPAFGGTLEGIADAAPAPAIDAADPAGERHSLSDYDGHVVLVNFWASWCPPCLQEMPSLQRLSEAMAGTPFQVLAINVGETPQRAVEAMRRLGYRDRILLDTDQAIFDAWGATVLPSSFLIGCDGRVRFQAFGPLEWDSAEYRERIEGLVRDASAGCSR